MKIVSYTQAPPLTDEEIEIFLKEPILARICTFNEDGTIHAVPVWFKYENGQFITMSPEKGRRTKNIIKNHNVTLLIDSSGTDAKGVIVYGTGKVSFEEWELEKRSMLEKYISKDVNKRLSRLNDLTKWVKVTIKAERMTTFDYGKDKKFAYAMGP